MQAVEVELDPGETVIAEACTMNWMEEGIQFEPKWGTDLKLTKELINFLY